MRNDARGHCLAKKYRGAGPLQQCSSAAVAQLSPRAAPLQHLWTQVSKGCGIGSAQKFCVRCAAASAAAAAYRGMKQAPGGFGGIALQHSRQGAQCGPFRRLVATHLSKRPVQPSTSCTHRSMARTPWGPDQRAGSSRAARMLHSPQIHGPPTPTRQEDLQKETGTMVAGASTP